MATKKGTKMSLAAFVQQGGGSDPNALPTAPRQRDPNETADAASRHSRAWKTERFDSAEGERRERRDDDRSFGRERRGRREEGSEEGEESGPSKADTSSQWRSVNSSSSSSDRRPRYEDRGDRDGFRRDRGDRADRDREDRPPRERESRGPSDADHVNDWRSSSAPRPPSRYDDRDRRERSDRDRDRDDRRDFDRDRRPREDREERDKDSGAPSRWSSGRNDRDRDDDRRSGGRFDKRDGDRREDRVDRERTGYERRADDRDRPQRDDRPAHLRFNKGRSDAPSSSSSSAISTEDFPSLKDRPNRTPEVSATADGEKEKAKTGAATALERLAKRKAEATKEKDGEKENRSETVESEKEKDKEDKPEEEKSKKKSSKKPVAASPLEAALKGSVFLSDIQFAESMNWLTDEKDRLEDSDQRKEIIVAVALSVIEKKLSLAAVIDSLDNSALSNIASGFVLDVIKAIQTRRDESVALAAVKSAGQDKVLGYIASGLEKDKLDAFLAANDVAYLAPVPDLSESVNKAVKNGESAESILKLIESSVDRKANVSYLLPFVNDKFFSLLFAEKTKANLSVVKEFSALLSRVSAFDKLAKVSLVGAVVNSWYTETKGARGVLKEVLEALLSGKVLSVEVLTDWKDSKEKGTAKMKALLQIATWISELVPKREEPEEPEEEEEEEAESDLMANPNQSD